MALQSGEPYEFPVDVPPGKGLGVDIQWRTRQPVGYEITAIRTEYEPFILQWNERSAQTFPKYVIRVGDIIVRVNAARTHKDIVNVLKQQDLPWLLVIARIDDIQETDAEIRELMSLSGIGWPMFDRAEDEEPEQLQQRGTETSAADVPAYAKQQQQGVEHLLLRAERHIQ